MKKFKVGSLILMFFLVPFLVAAQTESVDLDMVFKIKQYGKSKSKIEDLSFWMTDFLGPRLTASQGKLRANGIVKDKLVEFGLSNAVVEEVRPFDRGGWDNEKTYVAMTAPYYCAFAALPKAWTGSTNGLIKGEVIMLDIKTTQDLDKYKGKLKGKIAVMPSTATYTPTFKAVATRYTYQELID